MRFSDIDDCGMCLVMKRGYCKGGVGFYCTENIEMAFQ